MEFEFFLICEFWNEIISDDNSKSHELQSKMGFCICYRNLRSATDCTFLQEIVIHKTGILNLDF